MSGHTRDRMKKAATEAAERLAKRADFYTDKDELDDVKAVLAEHVACFEDFRAACGRLPASDQDEIGRTYDALKASTELVARSIYGSKRDEPKHIGRINLADDASGARPGERTEGEPEAASEGRTEPLVSEPAPTACARPDAS